MRPDDWSEMLAAGTGKIGEWEQHWPEIDADESLAVAPEVSLAVLDELAEALRDNYPFFHPSYAGQMLKPPHPVAAAAYAMAQRINPNAHALDGGQATARLELEVVRALSTMCGFPAETSLGHLTSSGTIANLEALWVSREIHPEKGIAYSEAAHYTHERMCQVLRVQGHTIPATEAGRMDLDALESSLATGTIGTIVATAGTTSVGAVDQIDEIVRLARRHGARVHIDAAYGGFFRLLAEGSAPLLRPETRAALAAMSEADSIVIDPHKHGLQSYGCGSVLFRDSSVGRFYRHDSPYTYFTSDELHLGEISLECSRAGAAAAALWATLRVLPLEAHQGIGAILRKTRLAALRWSELLREDAQWRLVVDPDLDIIAFYALPEDGSRTTSAVSTLTQRVFTDLMHAPPEQQLFLATLRANRQLLHSHELQWDTDDLLVFRSVLMKPEHLRMVDEFHQRLVSARGAG
ncbi:MAG: aspartate aminotransferase family protein [Thermomicrobiales bacterium]